MVSAIQILKPLASGISCVVDRRARSAVVRAQQASTHALPRRDCLALVGLLASGVACQPAVAYSELDSFLPDERIPSTLPKGFVKVARELINALRAPIELEQMGAGESEVRAKASGASGPVREFLQQWKDKPSVADSVVHQELVATIEELGKFYQRAGQRTPLDKQTSSSIIRHLNTAELELPIEPEKEGLFGGIFSGK